MHHSASHFVIMMVKKYPYARIVNFDKLDYCSCLANLDCIKESVCEYQSSLCARVCVYV